MKEQDDWRFAVQVLFSSTVLIFCLYKLAYQAPDGRDNALYWGGITGLLAWWMPSPGGSQRDGVSPISFENATIGKTQIQASKTAEDRSVDLIVNHHEP